MVTNIKPTLGRKMILTDVDKITKENIKAVVSKAFCEHQENVAQEIYLFEYEKGRQEILDREKLIRPEINNRIVENNASKIVDVHVGYCFSNPITFVQRAKVEAGKKDNKDDDMKISMLNKMMQEQAKGSKDIELARNLFICGVGYQMILPHRKKNRFSPFEIAVPSPLTTFVVYSNDAYREPMLACTYFIHDDGVINLTAYAEDFCYELKRDKDEDTFDILMNNSTKNYFGTYEKITANALKMIPIVEFKLTDRMGIFEKVIPILNAINLINSDRINDIMQHVQSLLWMHNCQINEDEKKNLVDGDGVIMTKSTGDGNNAKIEYLGETLDEAQIQTLVDYYNSQVQEITSTPSWQEASGGSTTGAMQLSNGWQCLEISAKTVEQLYTEPEMQILDLALEIIKNDKRPYDGLKDIELSDIEIRFCRTKTYDLVSKTNSLVALLNAGVDGLTSFNTVGLFTDPQQAWNDSKKIVEGMQKKLAAKDEKQKTDTLPPNPNAFKDEDGNGGENNTEKDKTEESLQPSKVAGVEG